MLVCFLLVVVKIINFIKPMSCFKRKLCYVKYKRLFIHFVEIKYFILYTICSCLPNSIHIYYIYNNRYLVHTFSMYLNMLNFFIDPNYVCNFLLAFSIQQHSTLSFIFMSYRPISQYNYIFFFVYTINTTLLHIHKQFFKNLYRNSTTKGTVR